jgi:tRNA(Ile)-lysidine synthase TilS/MesJ
MRHIVALSGGKDSTAMALRLAEVEPLDYEFVITPTR